ncbi:hypothetical protein P167DRAFT_336371 [Morchella conica CCBAS932]|uniref:Uncharacterized protein n=1 Tax=Morchella conica CCBAS932 TaxID=1392247 RepID=A0A3N4KDS3_9PEZI|nr:hypothetical protein P167DRAFT_336371 [Morchella conica CCBAS932]
MVLDCVIVMYLSGFQTQTVPISIGRYPFQRRGFTFFSLSLFFRGADKRTFRSCLPVAQAGTLGATYMILYYITVDVVWGRKGPLSPFRKGDSRRQLPHLSRIWPLLASAFKWGQYNLLL